MARVDVCVSCLSLPLTSLLLPLSVPVPQAMMHRTMRDGIAGRPFMGWDDVSGFQPPSSTSASGGRRGGVAFAGVQPLVVDVHPGMWLPGTHSEEREERGQRVQMRGGRDRGRDREK
jgi:hypothetical protein